MDIKGMIMDGVQDKLIQEVSQRTGLSAGMSQQAIKLALPLIMGRLSQNADTEEGKQALNAALDDHDETNALDEAQGGKILGHIFGDDEDEIEEEIAAKAGVSKDEATSVTKMIAPFVMGKLGAAKKAGDDVAGDLNKDSLAKGLLNNFLDKDKDGSINDDLLGMGMDFAKKKFFG